jgi:hypothetical protein
MMPTDAFFRFRLEQMIDLRHPLAVLAKRMPWAQIEATLAPTFAHKSRRSLGDALHTVLCAVGYNLRWLMRAVLRLGLTGFFALCVLAVSLVEFRQSRGAGEVCRKI